MVVRHDLMLICDILMSCPLALITFTSAFYSNVLMSHVCLYPVVYISHIWMQDVRLG